ncbi:hypothetical protein C8Q69DRAFT_450575 [Paecilomyces variotii]|uniref:Uncharacterized protein n=1 Tax=Byssochlamys spectabilis TaxID=264951 RepID=A0A443I5N1_BYSSP|nr:hypothetical protein C8Q69DRAFT_450575 [Paecilomyces variotii]KAJ9354538.1 hypothetical protein DTO280E4_6896 [Paecilomyces variotii]RWQ99295.1 hypothetical protein C8Q69DRAFT_450575 [Paecilomyces variotii]
MAGRTPDIPLSSTIPTRPDSPRKRRRHLRESDETEGFMFIEQYLHRSDPYRSTSVDHPLPYPISTRPARGTITTEASEYYTPIADILKKHGFHGRYDIGVVEVTRPGYPGGERPTITLMTEYRYGAVFPLVPGHARDEIRDLLRRNLVDLHVEIVDLQNCFRPSLFAISPEHPTVRPYEQAKGDLIDILTKELGANWRTLCLFEVGPSKQKAEASIVVLVEPQTNSNWSNIRFSMLRAVRRFLHPDVPLQVEFLPGDASPFSGDTASPRSPPSQRGGDGDGRPMLHLMDGVGRLQRGMSIGIKGVEGGGTMGGFVTFKRNNVTYQGILTNYHVVRPDNHEVTLADRKGITIDDWNHPNIEIVYPATKDARATKRQAQGNYDRAMAELQHVTERRDQNIAIGRGVTERESQHIKDLDRECKLSEKTVQSVKHLPAKIGNVTFASGFGVMGSRFLDWAFVEITEPDIKKFFGCDRMPRYPYWHMSGMENLPVISFRDEGTRFAGIREMKKGDYYIMVGRTSDVRVGRCNGTLATCHWRDSHVRYDENGNAVETSKVCEEWVVMGQEIRDNKLVQGIFCQRGDSGAFLIDTSGYVCGLLYGYLDAKVKEDLYTHAGLVNCMGDVQMSARALITSRNPQGAPSENSAHFELPFP